MKFFKPEDFLEENMTGLKHMKSAYLSQAAHLADKANAKLEREGRIMYAAGNSELDSWDEQTRSNDKYKALLIAIEPIENCKHPKEKITRRIYNPVLDMSNRAFNYFCDCGVRVEPDTFREVRE